MKSEMGRGSLFEARDGSGSFPEVHNGSWDLQGGLKSDGEQSGRFGTGRETLGDVREWTGNP